MSLCRLMAVGSSAVKRGRATAMPLSAKFATLELLHPGLGTPSGYPSPEPPETRALRDDPDWISELADSLPSEEQPCQGFSGPRFLTRLGLVCTRADFTCTRRKTAVTARHVDEKLLLLRVRSQFGTMTFATVTLNVSSFCVPLVQSLACWGGGFASCCCWLAMLKGTQGLVAHLFHVEPSTCSPALQLRRVTR